MRCTADKETPLSVTGGHDWELVPATEIAESRRKDCLWACPCGEFKWTSYVDWEQMLQGVPIATKSDAIRDATKGSALTREDIQATVDRWKEPEGKPQWAERAREPGDIPAES